MIKADCIHFKGDKPCAYKRLCDGCPHFKPFPQRILIIKCRAQGDVLRTTALLPGIKRKYPQSYICWLVDKESQELLLNNPYVDKIFSYDLESLLTILTERFDILISLDKEPQSTSLATQIKGIKKYGFGMNEYGNLIIFNKGAEYAYRLGIDDELKFHKNQKTYQEQIFEIAEIGYKKDPYIFPLNKDNQKKAKDYFKKNNIKKDQRNLGLNTGAGTKFETKQWPPDRYLKLIEHLTEKLKANIFLLGGKKEKKLNHLLETHSKHKVYNTGNDHSLLEFAGFISLMDLLVSSDTLGMHIAIALGKKVIALFGSTCPQEIDLYGRGTKIFAGVSCSPCYKQTCSDMKCMEEISAEHVFKEIKKLI